MWLVLADRHDGSAAWVARALEARGLAPLKTLSADALALAEVLEHRLDARRTTLRLRLDDGTLIDGAKLHGVLNRLYTVPIPHWRGASQADQAYVQQECVALALSWLAGLPCTVINRPTPQGLCGRWRQESEWAWLAWQAGLPVAPYRQSARDRIDESKGERRLVARGARLHPVTVLEGRVLGAVYETPLPAALAEGCARLARLAGTELLGIELVEDEQGALRFGGANPVPVLEVAGTPLVDALVERFTTHRHAHKEAA